MELHARADYACACGENPYWHPDEQRVYWEDIPTGRLFRYDPATGEHACCHQSDAALGGFTLQADGALLLFGADGRVQTWRDGVVTNVLDALPDERGNRFNDVIADPEGRVFCGTMSHGDRSGRLYRLDPDGSIRCVVPDIGTSNGLGFSPDLSTLYYADSPALVVYAFDYDRASGELSNQRVHIRTEPDRGVPDGLTIDAAGELWLAKWDGWCLEHYGVDGRLQRRLEFPVRKVSSVVFGGPDYGTLWVTSAGGEDKPGNGPAAGALFELSLGVTGRPEFRSRIGL